MNRIWNTQNNHNYSSIAGNLKIINYCSTFPYSSMASSAKINDVKYNNFISVNTQNVQGIQANMKSKLNWFSIHRIKKIKSHSVETIVCDHNHEVRAAVLVTFTEPAWYQARKIYYRYRRGSPSPILYRRVL